jgi:hypothetical protein
MQSSRRRTVHSVPIQYGPPYYGLFPPGGGCFGSFWRASNSSKRLARSTAAVGSPFLSPADREVLDWCSGIRPSPLYAQAGAQPGLKSTEQQQASIARLAPILSPGSRASPRRPVHGGGVPASSTIPSRSRSRLRPIPRFLSSLHTQILCVRAHTLGL